MSSSNNLNEMESGGHLPFVEQEIEREGRNLSSSGMRGIFRAIFANVAKPHEAIKICFDEYFQSQEYATNADEIFEIIVDSAGMDLDLCWELQSILGAHIRKSQSFEVPDQYQMHILFCCNHNGDAVMTSSFPGKWRTNGWDKLNNVLAMDCHAKAFAKLYRTHGGNVHLSSKNRIIDSILEHLEYDGVTMRFIKCQGDPQAWTDVPLNKVKKYLYRRLKAFPVSVDGIIDCTKCMDSNRNKGVDSNRNKGELTNPPTIPITRELIEEVAMQDENGDCVIPEGLLDHYERMVKEHSVLVQLSGGELEPNVHRGVEMFLNKNNNPLPLATYAWKDPRLHHPTRHSIHSFQQLWQQIDLDQVHEFTRSDGSTVAFSTQFSEYAWANKSSSGDWDTKFRFIWFPWNIMAYLFGPSNWKKLPLGVVQHYPHGAWHEVRLACHSGTETRCSTGLYCDTYVAFCLVTVLFQLQNYFNEGFRTPLKPQTDGFRAFAFVNPRLTQDILLYPLKIQSVLGTIPSNDMGYVMGANLAKPHLYDRSILVTLDALKRIRATLQGGGGGGGPGGGGGGGGGGTGGGGGGGTGGGGGGGTGGGGGGGGGTGGGGVGGGVGGTSTGDDGGTSRDGGTGGDGSVGDDSDEGSSGISHNLDDLSLAEEESKGDDESEEESEGDEDSEMESDDESIGSTTSSEEDWIED